MGHNVIVSGIGLLSSLGMSLADATLALTDDESLNFLKPIVRNKHIIDRFIRVGEIPFDAHPDNRPMAIINRALDEAMNDAGLAREELGKAGIFVGTTTGFISISESRSLTSAKDTLDLCESRGAGEVAAYVAETLAASGPLFTYSVACTSSTIAILQAYHAISLGLMERAVVVGYESLLNSTVRGFRSLLLYDDDAVRPFDQRRRGLQLGEGCGVLILESEKVAKHALCSLLGGAQYTSKTGLTGSDSSGDDVYQTVKIALERSACHASSLTAIKAHGTGTLDNDLAEGRGLARIFSAGVMPPFTSLKPYLGHGLGAAGAMEAALWVACVSKGFMPKTLGFETADPKVGIAPITEHRDAPRGRHLLTNFGFGGSGVALILDFFRGARLG